MALNKYRVSHSLIFRTTTSKSIFLDKQSGYSFSLKGKLNQGFRAFFLSEMEGKPVVTGPQVFEKLLELKVIEISE